MASILCGKCRNTHRLVESVRNCYQGKTILPCDWLIERQTEDGPAIVECGADAIWDDRGFECAAGHSHVTAEHRRAEGWDYAEDEVEAQRMAARGTIPVQMDGRAAWAV